MTRDTEMFEPDARSARAARRFVVDALVGSEIEVPTFLPLLVSELASNAVLHAGTPFRVVVDANDDRIRVEVHDGSEQIPTIVRPTADAVTGRGLPLIEDLADRWGAAPIPGGKCVWFEFTVPSVVEVA